MRLTTFDNLDIAGGALHRWTVSTDSAPVPHPTGPSENERFHLDAVRDGGLGWLAITFDIDSATLDLARLRSAFAAVVNHHEVLRAHFAFDTAGSDSIRRFLHPAGSLSVSDVETVRDGDAGDNRAALSEAIVDGCSALTPGSHVLAAVEGPTTTTVICAFDHCYVDAHSLAVIAEDVLSGYEGEALRSAGSFLDHQAAAESARQSTGDGTLVDKWGEFLASTGWTVPEFPVDLGVAPGQFAPARIHVDTVLTAEQAHRFSALCASQSIRFYPALLAALAVATRDLGGPDRVPLVLPVHTRRSDLWSRSVGWFVANAPMVLDATGDIDAAMTAATAALSEALPLAEVDLTTVYGTFGSRMIKPRHDVFMVSYMDYRRFDRLAHHNVHHVSSDGRADTLQAWFWRDENGVHLRTRYPDTGTAATVVKGLVDDMIAVVTDRLATVGTRVPVTAR
ncbi:condensation domain-containing protein [Williamsia sp. MIQD14]|uniref:condensation domain-containing protein n=1 Tax=Williamsia sp. MIQD14 TaxID=3425703 RepID=UPI003DA18B8D